MAMVVAFFFTTARTYQQKSSTVIFQLPKVFLLKLIFIKKWLINCSYNPRKNNIGSHPNVISKTLDTYYGKYEKVVFLGDFHAGINFIKQPTCFKNPQKPSYFDLILTNMPKSFQTTYIIVTGLPDFHRLTVSVLKMHF